MKGNGSQVTKKFKPKSFEIADEVPGVEQYHTEKNMNIIEFEENNYFYKTK